MGDARPGVGPGNLRNAASKGPPRRIKEPSQPAHTVGIGKRPRPAVTDLGIGNFGGQYGIIDIDVVGADDAAKADIFVAAIEGQDLLATDHEIAVGQDLNDGDSDRTAELIALRATAAAAKLVAR